MKNGDSTDKKDVLEKQEHWASTLKKQRQDIRKTNSRRTQLSSVQSTIKKARTFIGRIKKGCIIAIGIIIVFMLMIFTLALF